MYVLCSPCILNPALRAEGITRSSDLKFFRRAAERCEEFGIEMVPLPCPETQYLGPSRRPGTFLDRLNTPEFTLVLDELTKTVQKILDERGSPLCIIGVNSSPTCGVTSTYYGAEGDLPPRRPVRGVFLSRFDKIRAIDVAEFSRFKVYLAAPLFSLAERNFNSEVAAALQKRYLRVYLPQHIGDSSASRDEFEHSRIFHENLRALEDADIIVAIIDGADADSGTAWEMGYAWARGKRVIALRTDFRHVGRCEQVNLMLEESSEIVTCIDDLLETIKTPLTMKADS